MSHTTEIYWINLQLKNGDHKAFLTIYQEQHQLLYHFAHKFIKDDDDVHDILHDAFLRLWQARHRISCKYPIERYLFRITRNLIYQHLRQKAKSIVSSVILDPETADLNPYPSAETNYIENEYRQIYKEAVDNLPPQRRKIFQLSREEGKSYKEIACFLGISHQTVKEHMSLAMKGITDYIRNEHDIVLKIWMISLIGFLSV